MQKLTTSLAMLLMVVCAATAQEKSPGIEVVEIESKENPFEISVKTNHPDRVYRAGDQLELEITSNKDGYCYVFYKQADGETICLFPNSWQQDNQIRAAESLNLPPKDGARYTLRITAKPRGVEKLNIVVSNDKLSEETANNLLAKKGPPRFQQMDQHTKGLVVEEIKDWKDDEKVRWQAVQVEVFVCGTQNRYGLYMGPESFENLGQSKQLRYAATEAQTMASLLKEKCDIYPHAVLTKGRCENCRGKKEGCTCDNELLATKESFIREVENLGKITQPGDLVLIYITSHATRARDRDRDEPDNKGDEAICFSNSNMYTRNENVNRSILTDDEFGVLLQENLSDRKVLVILDVCFAEGFARGKSLDDGIVDFDFLDTPPKGSKDIGQVNALLFAATRERDYAMASTRGMTRFAVHLQSMIKGHNQSGPLTVYEMAENVAKAVEKERITMPNSERIQKPILIGDKKVQIELIAGR